MVFAHFDVGDGRGPLWSRSRRRVPGIDAKQLAGTGGVRGEFGEVGPTRGSFPLSWWESRRHLCRCMSGLWTTFRRHCLPARPLSVPQWHPLKAAAPSAVKAARLFPHHPSLVPP